MPSSSNSEKKEKTVEPASVADQLGPVEGKNARKGQREKREKLRLASDGDVRGKSPFDSQKSNHAPKYNCLKFG